MWILVLVVGLGGIAIAVIATFIKARTQRRTEHARLWREHKDWQDRGRRQDLP